MKTSILMFTLLALAACSTGSTVISGPVTEAIAMNQVRVINSTPDCEFEMVALIQFPGGYFSRAALIDGFREKSAALGAPIVQVIYLQSVAGNEYYGSARALRCL